MALLLSDNARSDRNLRKIAPCRFADFVEALKDCRIEIRQSPWAWPSRSTVAWHMGLAQAQEAAGSNWLAPFLAQMIEDPYDVVRDPEIDIVVELIGGEDLARDLALTAIAGGKHLVSANKALLAEHGRAIQRAAREACVNLPTLS